MIICLETTIEPISCSEPNLAEMFACKAPFLLLYIAFTESLKSRIPVFIRCGVGL